MVGLSFLLLVGLIALAWVVLSSGIDWDASVVRLEHTEGSNEETPGSSDNPGSVHTSSDVIRFDLDKLNSEGLFGPEDGLRALSYEFCIPATEAHVKEVQAIDATTAIQQTSPGRIGCAESEYLVIGSTYQTDFREVLDRLPSLSSAHRIDEAFFEKHPTQARRELLSAWPSARP